MKQFVIIILSILCISEFALSQPLVVPKPKFKERSKWEVSFGYSMSNASIFHDINGKRVSILVDTLLPNGTNLLDTSFRQWTFQNSQYAIFPMVKWSPTEDLSLSGLINISYTMLDERYRYDTNYHRQNRANLSLFQVDYLELATNYYIFNTEYKLAITAGTRIPFGFEQGQHSSKFLCDGAIEVLVGGRFQFPLNRINVVGGIHYNWRDEDLQSRMIYNLRLGIVSVPGTELSGFVKFIQPLKPHSEFKSFNIRYRPLNEETFQAGANFRILFENDMFADLGYFINLAGKHTFGIGTFHISLGTRF